MWGCVTKAFPQPTGQVAYARFGSMYVIGNIHWISDRTHHLNSIVGWGDVRKPNNIRPPHQLNCSFYLQERKPGSWVEDVVLRGIMLGNINQPNLQERTHLKYHTMHDII
ncbi:MAG: hypothetical protein F6J90_09960 [Moorea sp. SIOASIH]|uniref:hypothetical protein n=1 Tax=Moorena sp. SIOASIH TaxID=2607817 RepID=UPI0013B93A1E|nr:hypothetical protein [Moorena sp. SIOASIH]NEO36628.1 hypothetical protein [Moorena sp. SIOASIH]